MQIWDCRLALSTGTGERPRWGTVLLGVGSGQPTGQERDEHWSWGAPVLEVLGWEPRPSRTGGLHPRAVGTVGVRTSAAALSAHNRLTVPTELAGSPVVAEGVTAFSQLAEPTPPTTVPVPSKVVCHTVTAAPGSPGQSEGRLLLYTPPTPGPRDHAHYMPFTHIPSNGPVSPPFCR